MTLRRARWLILVVVAIIACTARSAGAQTVANGPYYATPSWDQKMDSSVRFIVLANWNSEAVKSELERRGLKPRPDMVGDNFKSFHVYDPDGWDLQISNQTKTTRGSGSGD